MQSSEAIGTTKRDAGSAGNLGERLRRAREAQDLSLDAVSAELRISVPALTALEACRFDALGPPVFARGYLRHYGARLGLDVGELLAEYESMAGDTSVELAPSKTIRLRDERQIMIWTFAVLALALAAAILAAWWWLDRGAAADGAAVSDGAAVAAGPEADAEPPAIAEPARAEPPVSPRPEARPGRDVSESDASIDRAAARVPSTGPGAAASETLEPYTGPTLEIVFLEDSWAEITDAEGERLYYDLGRAGTSASIRADRDLSLFFGNAAGVGLRLDGEPIPIPARARRGDLAQFDLAARTGQTP